MRTICAWCHTTLDDGMEETSAAASVSYGICPACAARVLSEKFLSELGAHMLEMLRMQALLLEMVGDLYEVAQGLAPKAGIGLQPADSVRAWQQQRGSEA